MLYILFVVVMLIAGVVLLFTLMSKRAIKEGTRVAEDMIEEEDVVVPKGTEGLIEPKEEAADQGRVGETR